MARIRCSLFFMLVAAVAMQAAASAARVTVERHAVRFAAEGGGQLLRVQVSSAGGEEVFDSGSLTTAVVQWDRRDHQGRSLPDGMYLASITFRDAAGQVSETVEEIILWQEQETGQQEEEQPAVMDITGGGTAGKIAKWTSLTNLGNSVMTEYLSRIGIGTSLPSSLVHLQGTQPSPSAGNGVTALPALQVFGGRGGNTTSGGFTAGRGSSINLSSGPGGNAVGGSTNGSGGNITLQGGAAGTGGSGGVRGNVLLNPVGGKVAMGTSTPTNVYTLTVAGGGSPHGILGSSTTGYGVVGYSTNTFGVVGNTSNVDSAGVFGRNLAGGTGVQGDSTNGYGVVGGSTTGIAVYGTSTSGHGVWGTSTSGTGVSGVSTSGTGVFGYSASGHSGYFTGKVYIGGPLTKPAGSFQIDHPLDPANKLLSHSFVESPDMMNIYNGMVALDDNGEATVEMPAWFEALNSDFRYQLTCVGGFAPVYIAQKVDGNRFKIAGGRPGLEVSWQVTGIRQDAYAQAHRIRVEEDKPEKERGYYLHPKEFGQPEEKGVEHVRSPAARAPGTALSGN